MYDGLKKKLKVSHKCYHEANLVFCIHLLLSDLPYFFCVTKNRGAIADRATKIVNIIIGVGSYILPKTKLNDEKRRARKLQIPMAVEAKSTGKKYAFAAKVILKVQVTPNFANR